MLAEYQRSTRAGHHGDSRNWTIERPSNKRVCGSYAQDIRLQPRSSISGLAGAYKSRWANMCYHGSGLHRYCVIAQPPSRRTHTTDQV
jgi:hypothetical protein